MIVDFPPLTPEQCLSANSETAKYRHLVGKYLDGPGCDVASQGDPVCEWAMSLDLPEAEFLHYSDGRPPKGPIQLRCHADNLPFESHSLHFCLNSHMIEDYPIAEWPRFFTEFARVIRHGGYVIILCPEKGPWDAYVAAGGQVNCAHRHEAEFGELSMVAKQCGLEVVEERRTACYPGDYSLLMVAKKP